MITLLAFCSWCPRWKCRYCRCIASNNDRLPSEDLRNMSIKHTTFSWVVSESRKTFRKNVRVRRPDDIRRVLRDMKIASLYDRSALVRVDFFITCNTGFSTKGSRVKREDRTCSGPFVFLFNHLTYFSPTFMYCEVNPNFISNTYLASTSHSTYFRWDGMRKWKTSVSKLGESATQNSLNIGLEYI